MSDEDCREKTVTLQDNGIIRNEKGVIIGRIKCENDYDMAIHSSTSALEWAELFIKTKNETSFEIDKDLMLGWFANAMMAMHDSIFNNEIKKLQAENKILRDAVGFYASTDNWTQTELGGNDTTYIYATIDAEKDLSFSGERVRFLTGGKTARSALEKTKQGEK